MSMVDENFRLTAISEDDVSSHQSDNGVYIDDVGGMNNQRQIFGLSSEAVKFRPPLAQMASHGLNLSN